MAKWCLARRRRSRQSRGSARRRGHVRHGGGVPSSARAFIPSGTGLQLLRNLGSVRDELVRLGNERLVRDVDQYLAYLQQECAEEVAFVDYVTGALGHVYEQLSHEERRRVFQNYQPAFRSSPLHAYAPKGEVQFFCQMVEPGILSLFEG